MPRLLALLLLTLGAALGQVRLAAPAPSLSGVPGEYLTLGLRVEGRGSVRFLLQPPEGWLALSQERQAVLEGKEEVLSFTLRVPLLPAGSRGKAVVLAYAEGKEVARTEVELVVLPLVQVALAAPTSLEADLGGPFEFPAYVTNRSNQEEEVLLEGETAMFQVVLNPRTLRLKPGETGVVRVLVAPEGRVSPGYRFYMKLRAVPKSQPEARREAGVIVLFKNPLGNSQKSKDPELSLGLGLGVSLGATVERDQLRGQVSYTLTSNLSGALSDYVKATATPSPLTGDLDQPLRPPQVLTLNLQGENWEAWVQGGGGSFGLAGSLRLQGARVALESRYAPQTLGFRVSAVSQDRNLDLQGSLATQITPSFRQDSLSLRYRLPLLEGLSLGLGTDLSGQAGDGYLLAFGLSQSLTWQTQELEVVQSYSGVPFAGLHALGLVGGTRRLYPFGLRGGTSLQLGPGGGLWQNQLSLFYQPLSGLLLSLTGSYRQGEGGRAFGLAPGLTATLAEPGLYAASLSLGYGVSRTLEGAFPESEGYQGSLSLNTPLFSLSGYLRYLYQENALWEGSLLLRIPLEGGSLEGLYLTKQSPNQTLTLYGAAWNHLWPGNLQSRLFYEYRERETPTQRFGLSLYQRNFLDTSFALGASYTLNLEGEAVRHELGLSLGYAQSLTFATPKEVVDLFGGRRGGEVLGQAFRDENLNGKLDPGEPPLAGLRVCLGRTCEVTDAAGRYRLVTAPGEGVLTFPGLPANLALVGEEGVRVVLNGRTEKDLPFAPAASLAVRVLDTGTGEGLAYAGVCAEGPVRRCTRADMNGRALLTGLFRGTYRVYPDPRYLPEGYREEGAKEVQVEPGSPGLEVQVVAAPPKRVVEVTYTADRLSLVATADPPVPLSGAEVEVRALVQGQPERVWLELPTGPVPLQPQGENLYSVRLRLPLPPGFHTLSVRAQGKEEVEAPLLLQVVQGPLFTPQALEGPKVRLSLRFRARQVALAAGEQRYLLKSEDGYTWTGEVPLGPGQHSLLVLADGETLGQVGLNIPAESASH